MKVKNRKALFLSEETRRWINTHRVLNGLKNQDEVVKALIANYESSHATEDSHATAASN